MTVPTTVIFELLNLVYEGEQKGCCNADDAFFDFMDDRSRWAPLEDLIAQLNEVHVVTETLHDCWAIWRRVETLEDGEVGLGA